jgi:hypothetical protein
VCIEECSFASSSLSALVCSISDVDVNALANIGTTGLLFGDACFGGGEGEGVGVLYVAHGVRLGVCRRRRLVESRVRGDVREDVVALL